VCVRVCVIAASSCAELEQPLEEDVCGAACVWCGWWVVVAWRFVRGAALRHGGGVLCVIAVVGTGRPRRPSTPYNRAGS
jgi:hypothetical protein